LDGTNMEGNGAQPDILIERNLNDIVADRDTQLQKAVSVLLEKLE
jgi:C-terminal processing protease CtpA/Prc